MILGDTKIIASQKAHNIFSPFDSGLVQGASYDLGLGRQYCKNGEIKEANSELRSLSIEPGEFVLATSKEKIQMPLNLVGHNGLMSKWTKAGLVSLFSPQIDPGFKGVLIVPIFNAGQSTITIAFDEPIFTVELIECTEASIGWSEKHNKEQVGIVSPWGPTLIGPHLGQIISFENRLKESEDTIKELREEIIELKAKATAYDEFESKFKSMRTYFLSFVGVVVGLLMLALKLELI